MEFKLHYPCHTAKKVKYTKQFERIANVTVTDVTKPQIASSSPTEGNFLLLSLREAFDGNAANFVNLYYSQKTPTKTLNLNSIIVTK